MFKLRDYQQEAVNSTLRYFIRHGEKSGNPVILLPTGTGKSLVIAGLLKTIHDNWGSTRMMVITHVKELIDQNHDKFKKLWPEAPTGIYSAGMGRKDKNAMITFAGIQSVAKQAKYFEDVDIIIVDECDLISPNQQTSYQKFFAHIREKNPYLKIIGLTATSWRLGFGSIIKDDYAPNALFDEIVFNACTVECFNWFIDEGYLVPLVPRKTKKEYDVSGVHTRGGEFIESELQKVVNDPDVTRHLLDDAISIAEEENRMSWLIFCAGVDHAKDVKDYLNERGISCEVVTGDTPKALRDQYLIDFKAGRLQAIANNNVLTTGFDHPGLDLIIGMRPSQSSRLWVQMLGRGTRPDYADGFDLTTTEGRLQAISASHKQNCLVLDYAGNTRRLGPINDPVIPKRPGQKGKSAAPVKECPVCKTWNHASVRYCGGLKPFDTSSMSHEEILYLQGLGYTITNNKACRAGYCGHEFTFEKKLMASASTKAIIKNDLPVTEVLKVDMVSYYRHENRGDRSKPPTLRVDYLCGSQTIQQYICLFHTGFAGKKARNWWREHCSLAIPANIVEALNVVSQLRVPTHIYVNLKGKFPEVLNSCYDGSEFGKKEATNERPVVQIAAMNGLSQFGGSYTNKFDEDEQTDSRTTVLHSTSNQPILTGNGKELPPDFDDDIPF